MKPPIPPSVDGKQASGVQPACPDEQLQARLRLLLSGLSVTPQQSKFSVLHEAC